MRAPAPRAKGSGAISSSIISLWPHLSLEGYTPDKANKNKRGLRPNALGAYPGRRFNYSKGKFCPNNRGHLNPRASDYSLNDDGTAIPRVPSRRMRYVSLLGRPAVR